MAKFLIKTAIIFCISFTICVQISAKAENCGEKLSTRMDHNVFRNQRFSPSIIDSQPILKALECYAKCMKNCRCVSYNICKDGKLCELNSGKKESSADLEQSDDCDYYEYEFSKKVSHFAF